MNLKLFLKHRYVRTSLLSLLGQAMVIAVAAYMLFYTDPSLDRIIALVVVLLVFVFIFAVTLLRLKNLAKVTDSVKLKS